MIKKYILLTLFTSFLFAENDFSIKEKNNILDTGYNEVSSRYFPELINCQSEKCSNITDVYTSAHCSSKLTRLSVKFLTSSARWAGKFERKFVLMTSPLGFCVAIIK